MEQFAHIATPRSYAIELETSRDALARFDRGSWLIFQRAGYGNAA